MAIPVWYDGRLRVILVLGIIHPASGLHRKVAWSHPDILTHCLTLGEGGTACAFRDVCSFNLFLRANLFLVSSVLTSVSPVVHCHIRAW
jgi:hypothetical protein